MTAHGIVVGIGGLVLLFALTGFVRSFWRKPPNKPGSNDPFGGMPTGSIGSHDINPGHDGAGGNP